MSRSDRPLIASSRPRRRGALRLLLGPLALAAALSACDGPSSSGSNAPNAEYVSIPLAYAPTDDDDDDRAERRAVLLQAPQVPAGTQVWIEPIADTRQDPARIGVTEEEDPPQAIYHAPGSTPGDFTRNVLAHELTNMGLPVAMSQEAASHTLTLTLLKFWVAEGNTYQAEIVVNATLTDASGAQLWQGEVIGKDSRWGRSNEEENYVKVLSDAALDLSFNLATLPPLRIAIAQPPAAAAPAPEAAPEG